jgi:rod shape-determining protein MreC
VWSRNAVSPLSRTGEFIGTLFSDLVRGVSDTSGLVIENRRLRWELETARARSRAMADDMVAQMELNSLATMLPLLSSSAVPARTTYRDLVRGRLIALVAVNRRIPPDTPAVGDGGVIGRVVRSEGRRCWIELITHPVAAVAVQTPDGTVQGLAVGSDTGDLIVQFIPRQAELLRGNDLVTSGADGIYPPGLPVGRVTSVRESANAFLEVRAHPMASLATTRVVLLLDRWMGAMVGEEVER